MEKMVQPKLSGYRSLSDAEAALMNDVKKAGADFLIMVERVKLHVTEQRRRSHESTLEAADLRKQLEAAEPERWAAMARTSSQLATMELCRAVAQPQE